LHAEGAHIVIADRDGDAARQLAARLSAEGGPRAIALTTDVTSEESTKAMAEAAERELGTVDVLVNNAGIYPHTDFEEISLDEWQHVMRVNLDSVFLCSRAILPIMKKAGRGKIINIATNLVWVGLAGMSHYIASKAGVVGFTRALAREAGHHGITVNAIAPGAVIPERELSEQAAARVNAIVAAQSLKRTLRADDLVGPLIFLASSDSDFMSGQILTIDGGLAMH
jgi:NAD(P)-dependent dehydrogenase (short-subunit alcohol dehydrogenase family)